jgi:hypothetical protein
MVTAASAVVALELVNIALILAFPGGGHSPFWYTQLPVLMVVALFNPQVGSCPECAPARFTVGWLAYTVVLCGVAAFLTKLGTPRNDGAP